MRNFSWLPFPPLVIFFGPSGTEPPSTIGVAQPDHAPSFSGFKAVEDTRAMQIDAKDPAKTVELA
jgi:hypothetical protein